MSTLRAVASLFHVRLAPGFTAWQAAAFLLLSIAGVTLLLLVPTMQPYVLQQQLHLPSGEFGRVGSLLANVQNIVMLVFSPFMGLLTDRIGPKPLLNAGLATMCLGSFLYPFADSLPLLIVLNGLIGLGVAGFYAGNGACILAFPHDSARGRFISALVVTQSIANMLLVGGIATHFPEWLSRLGLSDRIAGGSAFWLLALLGAGTVALSSRALGAIGAPRRDAGRFVDDLRAMPPLATELVRAAIEKPRFGMVLLLSCISRADFSMIFIFLSLWIVASARDMGVAAPDALKLVGNLLITFQVTNLISTIIFGYVADRTSRSTLMVFAMAAAGLAFLTPALVGDVFGWRAYASITVIGATEAIVIVGIQTLLGEETPAHLRGSAIGLFTVFGLIGVIVVNTAGGFMFDHVGHTAPFVLMGAVNLVFCLICLLPGRTNLLRRGSMVAGREAGL